MAHKRILVANADPRALEEFGQVLGEEWNVTLVGTAAAAIGEMAMHPCDVLVADLDLPQVDGAELLDLIHTEYPKTIRILLAGEADKERRMADVQGAHQILTKPCDKLTLKSAIERALALDVWLANDSLRELIGRLRTFPIVPSLYLEVVNALRSPHATTAEVGAVIAKDMAMMTKLLQVTNSACFGLPRKISDPVEAVGILGFETVKSMVMTLKLLSQYDKVKPVYFSIDRLWRHSTEVARTAKRLVMTQTDDPVLAESAFTAGLMHDLGKLILAANFDDQYSGAQALARQQQLPLWDVEKQIFRANHGELGAYLLGLWGMPLDLVEATALHHQPSRCLTKKFTSLTAVHVANALVYEVKPDKEGFVSPQVDEAYIAELGMTNQLKRWREMVLAPDFEGTEFRARGETVIVKKPGSPEPKPAARAPRPAAAQKQGAPAWFFSSRQWLYMGSGVAAFLLLFWMVAAYLTRPEALGPIEATVAPPTKPALAVVTLAAKMAAPVIKTSETNTVAVAPPAALAPTTNPAPVEPVAAAPAPLSGKDLAFSRLTLQSIFFSTNHPSAVISGQRVRPNDRLAAGALVVAIGPTSVTVEYENERKTLAFK